MQENYHSIFDIIGPVMVGPSSSHTAGAAALGNVAKNIFRQAPQSITIDYYESFAQTHRGHGTDFAIVGGCLGISEADPRIATSLELAKQQGISIEFREHSCPSPIGHPNTAMINLIRDGYRAKIGGCSIGGGKVEVREISFDQHDLLLPGQLPLCILVCSVKDFESCLALLTGAGIRIDSKNFCEFDGPLNLYVLNIQTIPRQATRNKLEKYCIKFICV